MKYSKRFEQDYEWYLSVLNVFTFDGKREYISKKGIQLIQFDENGLTAKECFYLYDSRGMIEQTKEPEKLKQLYKTKGSVNLHIKMYAEDRASGALPKIEFDKICEDYNVPDWFIKAVENQKLKHYNLQKRS